MVDDGIKEETKKKILGLLLALFPGAKIYLYGSRARGTHRERSDIDLAIAWNNKENERLPLGEARSILEATHIPYKIDLVDFNTVSSPLKEIIQQEGKLWNL